MSRRAAAWAVAAAVGGALVVAAAIAGCGTRSRSPDVIPGRRLTIYASLPLQGESRGASLAVLRAADLALAQTGGRVGSLHVRLQVLDDAGVGGAQWDPGQTSQNARLASADPTAVAYLGELNSGASAVSIPLLGRVGILAVSPASTAVGLTQDAPGADPGEPQKYYPSGVRTFARVVPNDAVQAGVLVRLERRLGCRATYVLSDGEFDGQSLAATFSLVAQRAGLAVLGNQAFNPQSPDYRSLAAAVATTRPDCVVISAIPQLHAALLTEQLTAALPQTRVIATAALADDSYLNPADGGVPARLDGRLLVVSPAPQAPMLPPAGRQFLIDYARRYGSPPPVAEFGYESMRLLLAAVARATDDGRHGARRSAVRAAVFATGDRPGAVGGYSIMASGDTTLNSYSVYRLRGGRLRFWTAVQG